MCFPRMMLLQVIIMTWVVGVILTSEMAASVGVLAAAPIAKPNCPDRCGDVEIPFPFGTSEGCYLDQFYFVNCTNDSSSKTRRLIYGNVDVLSISSKGQLELSGLPAYQCYNKSGTLMNETFYFVNSFGTISYTQNFFVAVGCDTIAYLNATKNNKKFSMGCISVCQDTNDVANGSCSGIGCCQVEIPRGLTDFSFEARSFSGHKGVWKFNPCSYAFIVKKDFRFSTKFILGLEMNNNSTFPVVFDWGIRNETCEYARAKSDFLCRGNSTCNDPDNGYGYRCKCNPGFDGNPYLPNGCQDFNECHDPRDNNCTQPERCKNTIGNYTCSCPKWKRGDGREDGTGCDVNLPLLIWIVVGIGITLSMLLVGSFSVYWGLKKRNLIKLREKFFQQNGGLVLQQRVSNHQGLMEPVRIFNSEELDKATKNYDKSRILGQGGNGTVYRGVLTDNKVVAIKRSKIADQNQIDQFINEMIVLAQINHRNVVKLLGCCLETEVPLLVYEFITNGTLSNHIHDKKKSSLLSWEKRLKIATEAAEAFAYLHFEASIPIIHRDVKTANILLDDNHTTKVADFGASRLIPLDHTRLTTLVQGTFGYLDPEYVRSGQLTEKSDVYSFGVVLAELLTGEKAVSSDREESEKGLAAYFISALKDDRLLEIIEGHLINEGNVEELKEVSYIAKRCLSIKGEDRPTMKEVAMELEGLRIKEKHSHEKADLYREETECCSLDATTSNLSPDAGTANSSTSTTIDSMGDQVSKSTIVC